MDKKYKCRYCNGEGSYEVHGPTVTGRSSWEHCHGSGEALVEITLREYEELKSRRKD